MVEFVTRNPKIGLLANAVMMIAWIETGLTKAYDKYNEKTELVRSIVLVYGADFICNNGLPSFGSHN